MAKRKASTVRTTISVPRDLKRRLERCKESINWSALACQAFQAKLAEIATKKEEKNMGDVIERLRASKREADSEHLQAGYAVGQAWAERSALARELERLDSLRNEILIEGDWETCFIVNEHCAYGADEWLYFRMHPEFDGDRSMAKEFWEATLGDDAEAVTGSTFAASRRVLWTFGVGSRTNCSRFVPTGYLVVPRSRRIAPLASEGSGTGSTALS
jgi:hypothetical protein